LQDFGRWVDAHSHLADPRWSADLDSVVSQAVKSGIGYFFQGGIGPQDWALQKELKQKFPEQIGLCFGLHPYWIIENSEENCQMALDELAKCLHQSLAIGEMGLDFRPHFLLETHEKQISFFEQQIEIADAANKPMVLHLVQAHDEALRIFHLWGVPAAKGMVHSFNGSWAKAQDFIQLGLSLSVGGPVARKNNKKLHEAVSRIPLEFLLIETDSPDQPPDAYKDQLNPPYSLWEVARKIAEIRGMTPVEILDITTSNFRRLFLK
jgi:TatD DNase family protein